VHYPAHHACAVLLLPAGGAVCIEGSSSQHRRGGSTSDALGSAAVERGIAKLFRAAPLCGVRFSASSLLAAVSSSALKSLLELIRLVTLGRYGLQQLQLDMYYLRPRLLRRLRGDDADTVAALLDDVVAAAAARSVDPVLLETATLDRALASLRSS
jgi:hypothetical protein